MEDVLRKYKLIDNFTVELSIDKSDFVRRLRDAVDPGEIGMFSGAFEAWESSNKNYKGKVSNQGFQLRRRKRFFESNGNMPSVATGTFREDRDKLTITTEVRARVKHMIPFYVMLTIIYTIALLVIGFTTFSDLESPPPVFILPFILVHGAFMFFLPYYIMKRGVAKLKRELEREFVFLANKG